MAKRGAVMWMLEQAFNDEDFSTERMAWIMASLSVGDVRNMFWNVEEFSKAFRLNHATARRWAREHEIPCIQFTKGGQWFFSKMGVLRALEEQVAIGTDKFPTVLFGASMVDAVMKGVRSGSV